MRRIVLYIAILLLAFPLALTAQSTPDSTSAKPADPKQETKDKQKDKKNKGNDTVDTEAVFNERVANDVLGQIRDGLEGHSQRTMLGAFDGDKMDGFLNFEDQIEAYFNKFNMFRVRFRIASASVEGTKGIALVDAEIECSPASGSGSPVRKRGQLRFELEKGKKGWKVVDFRDRNFFS